MNNCKHCGIITDNGKYCRKCKAQRVCEVCDDEINGLANHDCKGPKERHITLILDPVGQQLLEEALFCHYDNGPSKQSKELIQLHNYVALQIARANR